MTPELFQARPELRPGRRYGLPDYVWDPRMAGGRYRQLLPDGRLGRLVGRNEVVDLLRRTADGASDNLAFLSRQAALGNVRAAVFQQAFQKQLKAIYLNAAALGAGGWDRLGLREFGRVGGTLRWEYNKYLAGFAQDLADGKLTEAQAAARAHLYAGKAYSQFWLIDRELKEAAGYTEERWETVGDDRVCPDCSGFGAQGWQPTGTFPAPGDGGTQCLGACRCSLEHRQTLTQ